MCLLPIFLYNNVISCLVMITCDGDIDFQPRLAYQIGHKSCVGHCLVFLTYVIWCNLYSLFSNFYHMGVGLVLHFPSGTLWDTSVIATCTTFYLFLLLGSVIFTGNAVNMVPQVMKILTRSSINRWTRDGMFRFANSTFSHFLKFSDILVVDDWNVKWLIFSFMLLRAESLKRGG